MFDKKQNEKMREKRFMAAFEYQILIAGGARLSHVAVGASLAEATQTIFLNHRGHGITWK